MKRRRRPGPSAACALLALCACAGPPPPAPRGPAVLIRDVRLLDGSGAPEQRGALRMVDGRIVALGALAPAPGDVVVEGRGLVLAPGFIDTHSHHDPLGDDGQEVEAAVSQGITTIVVGQDGGSRSPLADFFAALEASPATVNVASYAGHSSARQSVMGEDCERAASEEEVARMALFVEADMRAGALGLSTGLEYQSATRATTDEVLALARVAARHGGRYISHIRSEDSRFWESIEELLLIGERARMPVQISHLKLAQVSSWGAGERLIARLEAARAAGVDVTADLYPYTFWSSTIRVFFPELDFTSLERATFAVTEASTPEGIRLGAWGPDPTLAGRTLAEIAAARGRDAARVLLELVAELDAYEASVPPDEARSSYVTAVAMTEADIDALLRWEHTNLCSDGGSRGGHPRGYGAFPRFLGHHVRERRALALPEAVHKATGLAADHMGFTDRGRLAPGLAADLVLFDPDTIADRATIESPTLTSSGIEGVWVNGQLVYARGEVTSARPGAVLRRGG